MGDLQFRGLEIKGRQVEDGGREEWEQCALRFGCCGWGTYRLLTPKRMQVAQWQAGGGVLDDDFPLHTSAPDPDPSADPDTSKLYTRVIYFRGKLWFQLTCSPRRHLEHSHVTCICSRWLRQVVGCWLVGQRNSRDDSANNSACLRTKY